MKRIKLTQGKYALVDDENFEWLNRWKWYCTPDGYAARMSPRPNRQVIMMHRFINDTPYGMETDHIDHDRLNNQLENLRSVTRAQNAQNMKLYKNNKSGYPGVCWVKNENRWKAEIAVNGKKMHLGYSLNVEGAILLKKQAEAELW